MSGCCSLASRNTYCVFGNLLYKPGLQPQPRPSTPRYAPQVLARVACTQAVQYASAVHECNTLQVHVGCEIPQWREPRSFVCAAKPLAVTFETSSRASLCPQCTVELCYYKSSIKTQCSPNLCTCSLFRQTVLYGLRSPSTSAKNGMS
jgi:hypothetical protein